MIDEPFTTFPGATSEPQEKRLAKEYVHRHREENVFVSRIESLHGTHEFLAELLLDPKHPFFFEHQLDHVPGLMLVEAGRQVATAIPHLFLKVPFGPAFIMNEVSFSFSCFAELNTPTYLRCTVDDLVLKHDRLIGMSFKGRFLQCEVEIASLKGRMSVLYAPKLGTPWIQPQRKACPASHD
jgi:hypothetical protein